MKLATLLSATLLWFVPPAIVSGAQPGDGSPAPVVTANQPIYLQVIVPDPNAQISVDGHATKSTGIVRNYQAAPLPGGQVYYYDVRASWMENGRPRVVNRHVAVMAGRASAVDFTTGNLTLMVYPWTIGPVYQPQHNWTANDIDEFSEE